MSSQVAAFSQDVRGRFDMALKKQLSELQRLGLNISKSMIVQEIRRVVGDTLSFVTDTDNRVEFRVKVMDELVGWLYTFFDGKTNEAARMMLACWAKLVHKFWYGMYMMQLEARESEGYFVESNMPDVETTKKLGRRFAELYVFPCGRVVVSVAFDSRMYESEFTALVQQMAILQPLGDKRFQGDESEFADQA